MPGPMELVIILIIVAMLFGVGKLPEIFGAVGKGLREFREEVTPPATPATPVTPVVTTVVTPAPKPAEKLDAEPLTPEIIASETEIQQRIV